MEYEQMVRSAVLNVRPRKGFNYQYRWVCVSEILGVGSTTANELCVKFGKDPDEKLTV